VPVWLDDVIGQATMPDPDDRFPSVALFSAALEARGEGMVTMPVSLGKGRCAMCRAPEPFGIGVCPRCARRAGAGDDVLVFLEGTTPGPARRAVREALEERLGGGASAAACEAVVAVERPLLRVPADAGARVVELLEAQGLPARVEARGAPWRAAVPTPIAVLACAVVAGGVAAGLAAGAPVLLITSPAVAAVLAGLAALGRRTPVWNPPSGGRSPLPAEAEATAVRVLAALPAGHARALLLDLLRRAAAVTAAADRVGPLVVAACAAARDLAMLEEHLAAFDGRRDRLAEAPAGWVDALSRCERGRDLLTQRLLDASATLSRLQAGVSEVEGGNAIDELARDLDAEGRRQVEAAREVAELLA
jgi:hypothetical protein